MPAPILLDREAKDIKEGDRLDLEGDAYGDNLTAEFEYAVVEVDPIRETEDCVLIHTNQGSFGFPTNHILKVKN